MNKSENTNRVILITGVSTGFGNESIKQLHNKGYKVYGIDYEAKGLEKLNKLGITTFLKDIRDYKGMGKIVKEIISKEGRIDILINNAGIALFGPVETLNIELTKEQFDTNFFAMLNLIQLVLPHMRKHNYGYIINISSVVGLGPFPHGAGYSTSKYAVEGLSNALKRELYFTNIKVCNINPSSFDTNLQPTAIALLKKNKKIDFWEEKVEDLKKGLAQKPRFPDLQDFVNNIFEIINTKDPKLTWYPNERSAISIKNKIKAKH